jgi:hypothetical protein
MIENIVGTFRIATPDGAGLIESSWLEQCGLSSAF